MLTKRLSPRARTWLALLATLTPIFIVYLATISTFVGGGDSGELIVDALHLAAPHPPGYPTYTFFAHWFTYLPISTMAWRVGFFSLCAQILCGAGLFFLGKSWLKKTWLAAAVTLLFCLAPLTWYFAVEAEVFALNNLFAVLLLCAFYKYHLERTPKWAYVTCGVLGLACTHHLTIIFFAAPFVAVFFWQDRKTLLRPGVFLIGVLFFALALTPYLFMFYLGRQRLLIAWGDLSNFEGFLTHVLRREYGTFQLATGDKENSTFLPKLYYFGREMLIQTFFIGSVLWAWGVLCLRKRGEQAEFARLVAFALAFYVLLFQYLSNLDLSFLLFYHAQSRMWMLPLLLIVLLMGWGLSNLEQQWQHLTPMLAAAVAVVIATSVAWNWRQQDRSERDFFSRLGHAMIDNVDPNAVILMREDVYVNTLRYLQFAENVRPDVHVIPLDAMWWPWMKELVEGNVPGFKVPGLVFRQRADGPGQYILKDLLMANIDRFPLYVAKVYPYEEQQLHDEVNGFSFGFHSRVKRFGQDFSLEEVKRETEGFLQLKIPSLAEHRFESWESYVELNYYDTKFPLGILLTSRSKNRVDWLLLAAEVFDEVAENNATYRLQSLNNLGAIYASLIPVLPAYKALAVTAWQKYLALTPPGSEENKTARVALEQLGAK